MAENTKKTPQEIALDAKLAELDAKMNAMLDLEERLKASAPQVGGIDAGQLKDILSEVSKAAAGPSQMLAKQFKVEFDHLQRGPFEHPQGGIDHPKPELKREIVFGGPLRAAELTYAEVLALNALSDSLARSQRRLARDGKWKATVSDDNLRLTISVPVKTIDDRHDLPSFLAIVQELTTGERALDAADMLAELTLLKAQMADMQKAAVSA